MSEVAAPTQAGSNASSPPRRPKTFPSSGGATERALSTTHRRTSSLFALIDANEFRALSQNTITLRPREAFPLTSLHDQLLLVLSGAAIVTVYSHTFDSISTVRLIGKDDQFYVGKAGTDISYSIESISTTNIEIQDKLIELGKVSSPSNSTANGGGILLEGGTDGDKTLTWSSSSEAWDSTENINLGAGKV